MARPVSLTTRLAAFYALASAIVLLGMALIIAVTVNRHFEDLDREALQDKTLLIKDIIDKASSSADLRGRLEDSIRHHPGLHVQIYDETGALVYSTDASPFPDSLVRQLSSESQNAVVTWRDGEKEYRAISAASARAHESGGRYRILAAIDTEQHAHFFGSMRKFLWVYVALAVLLSGMLGWWAARAGLAPLRAMKARAQAVTAHKLHERMPVETVPVEMADLATSLNDMLERLQSDFQRLSDFSSDLAHELRTPIANVLTQTQVALTQPRDATIYRDILASNVEEFQRLGRMVSDMLLLAKAEHGLLLPSTENLSLASEVQALFEFYEALADEKHVEMALTGEGHVTGDRLMLRRAISNLLSNALRYTPDQGRIRVEITSSVEHVNLTVENTGADINSEILPRLFDRFFRADKSRSDSATEGAGLGLSITRAIVQAHGGSASVQSTGGKTRFTLTFPAQRSG